MEVGGGDGEGTEGTRMGASGEDSNGFRAFVEFPTFWHGLFGFKCETPSNLIILGKLRCLFTETPEKTHVKIEILRFFADLSAPTPFQASGLKL